MEKRYRVTKRDIRGIACEILVPILIVIFGLAIITIKWLSDDDSVIITPKGLYG